MADSPALPLSADWYGANHAGSLRRSRTADQPETAGTGPGLADEAIDITFSRSDGRWTPAIHYRRPDVARLTVGLNFNTAQHRLGLVHSICGHAHQIAFARAGESAGLVAPQSPARRSARACSMIL